MLNNVKQLHVQSHGTKKKDIACVLEKCPKPTRFDAFFVAPDWVFWNDGFR